VEATAIAAAAANAGVQYGYITRRQALGAGLSHHDIARLVRDGHWVRQARGLFRIRGVKETWRGRLMAACLQAGDEAVVSHRSATAVWGIEGFEPPWTIDVTVPPDQRPRIARARLHRRSPATVPSLCGRWMTCVGGSWSAASSCSVAWKRTPSAERLAFPPFGSSWMRSNDFALDGWRQLLVTYRRTEESPESIIVEVEAALACRGGV
jgi:hypothetical protein